MNIIEKIEILRDYEILFHFQDGVIKKIDFAPFIGDDELTGALRDEVFFKKVKIYPNGRGIFWPNDYDVCPDFIRMYEPGSEMSTK